MDEAWIKKQKELGRELRKSRWWQNKIQNPICYYCEKEIAKEEVTMDHIVPLSEGGSSTKGNVCVCCKNCNNKKKNTDIVSWTIQGEKP